MAYSYQLHRKFIFTEEGVKALMAAHKEAAKHIKQSGAVKASKISSAITIALGAVESWDVMAVLEYMVETQVLFCVHGDNSDFYSMVYIEGKKGF